MPDTVKIPGIGPLDKKYAYIGAVGVAGFVGFAYWRNRNAAAAAPVDTTAATDTTALDAANAAANDPNFAYGSGDGGFAFGGGTPVYQSPSDGWFPSPTGNTITSDPEWAQKAVEWLASVGVDTQAASHAVSTYLADLCLTGAEADYVRQAKAGLGDPPQTHHNVTICTSPPPPPPPTGGVAVTGLHVTSTDKSGVSLAWNHVAGTNPLYLLHVDGGSLNHSVATSKTTYRMGALKKRTHYNFNVRAVVNSVSGPVSSTVSATTKSK